jgi:hypothetical protein
MIVASTIPVAIVSIRDACLTIFPGLIRVCGSLSLPCESNQRLAAMLSPPIEIPQTRQLLASGCGHKTYAPHLPHRCLEAADVISRSEKIRWPGNKPPRRPISSSPATLRGCEEQGTCAISKKTV